MSYLHVGALFWLLIKMNICMSMMFLIIQLLIKENHLMLFILVAFCGKNDGSHWCFIFASDSKVYPGKCMALDSACELLDYAGCAYIWWIYRWRRTDFFFVSRVRSFAE